MAADITALELPHGEVGRHVCGSCFRKNLKLMHVRTWGANGEKERARREKRRRQEQKEAGRKKKKKKKARKKAKKAGAKTGCACCGKGLGKRPLNIPEKVLVGLEHRGKGFEKLCNACYDRNRKWLKHGVPANPQGRKQLPSGTKVGCAGCGTFPIPVGKNRRKIPEGEALAIQVQRSATHCRLCNKCYQENKRRAAGMKKKLLPRLPPGTKMGCAACGKDIPEGKLRYNYPAELLLDLEHEGPGHSRLCRSCYGKNRRAVKRKKEKKRKREEEEEEPEKRKRGKK